MGFWSDFVCFVTSLFGGCSRGPDTRRPNVNCPSDMTVFTPELAREAFVEYSTATASARGSKHITSIRQISPSGIYSGDSFSIGEHRITFQAKDNIGIFNTCFFVIVVIARICGYPNIFSHGSYSCNTPSNQLPIYGEECTFTCAPGYNLIGEATQTCRGDESWSGGGTVGCEIVSCGPPVIPENTVINQCTADYNFESVCVFSCIDGFAMPMGAVTSIQCGEDGNWMRNIGACQDVQSPVISNCPDHQTVYVGANVDYAVATWEIPLSTDNVDSSVQVVLEHGLPPGSEFTHTPTNIHTIIYGAQDEAGNVAMQCVFNIIVQQITCPPIQHSPRLNVSCPDVLVYGARCSFQCDVGYPLVGPSEAYCEMTDDDPPTGFWEWGTNMSAPFCQVIPCPDLLVPRDGALVCDGWLIGLYCQMMCREGYDIPLNGPGEYVCSDSTGVWRPDDDVPDCTLIRYARQIRLPNSMYFSGDCTDRETQRSIREQFITNLESSAFSDICTLYEDCTVENVNVICGETSRRRRSLNNDRSKRQDDTHTVEISFDFVLNDIYDPQLSVGERDERTHEQFNILIDHVIESIQSGAMDITGLQYQEDAYQFYETTLDCDFGTSGDFSTFSCKPCSTGTFYNSTIDDCQSCPAGTYQDTAGEMTCITCPDGFSTEDDGSQSIERCIAKCSAGEMSSTGLVPCGLCHLNSYADTEMQLECQPCPGESITADVGATSILDCVADVIPGGPCSSDPCNSNGVCVRLAETYECFCANGFNGQNCEIALEPCAMHSCQDGSTCVETGDGENNYECQCSDEFTGEFCEHRIVNGAWNEWTEWSACGSSCGDSVQMRNRSCSNPRPNDYGDDCEDDETETQACNIAECPACPDLYRPYGVNMRCPDDGDFKVCSLECRPGLSTDKEYIDRYECGLETGYEWNPDTRPSQMMKCSAARFPRRIRASFQMAFVDTPYSSEGGNEVVVEQVQELAEGSAPCVESGDCSVSVSVSGDERREKRSTTTIFIITVDASVDEYDFMIDGVYNNETAGEGITELISLAEQLDLFARVLNESARNGSIIMVVDGETYYPDEDSLYFSGNIECSSGETTLSLICVNCPPGSYGDGEDCTLCSVGEYQELEGQVACESCPAGYTTENVGSFNATDCFSSGDSSSESREGSIEREDFGKTGVLAIALSLALFAVCVVLAVLINKIFHKKRDQVTPNRPTSAWGVDAPQPYVEGVPLRHFDPGADERVVNAMRYNAVPPLDTNPAALPKKPIGHL